VFIAGGRSAPVVTVAAAMVLITIAMTVAAMIFS
jgi:hypothetical protein